MIFSLTSAIQSMIWVELIELQVREWLTSIEFQELRTEEISAWVVAAPCCWYSE